MQTPAGEPHDDMKPPAAQPSGPDAAGHLPVLPDEVLRVLGLADLPEAAHQAARATARPNLAPLAVYVDGTLGRGGHASLVARALRRTAVAGQRAIIIVGFDLDRGNLAFAAQRLRQDLEADGARTAVLGDTPDAVGRADRMTLVRTLEHLTSAASPRCGSAGTCPVIIIVEHANFVEVPVRLRRLGLAADLLLADFGFASNQMDDPARGLSFRDEGPLDMRLDRERQTVTAADIVNGSAESALADLIFRYGEEPLARKVAKRILAERQTGPILTTGRLAQVVEAAYGPRARASRMHPATRTFMALRIAVNDELANIESLLSAIAREAVTLEQVRHAATQGRGVEAAGPAAPRPAPRSSACAGSADSQIASRSGRSPAASASYLPPWHGGGTEPPANPPGGPGPVGSGDRSATGETTSSPASSESTSRGTRTTGVRNTAESVGESFLESDDHFNALTPSAAADIGGSSSSGGASWAATAIGESPSFWLRPGSRIALISFHSLEDRPVKQTFAELTRRGAAEGLTRKPLTAEEAEIAANPRSRSAKLRAIAIASGPVGDRC